MSDIAKQHFVRQQGFSEPSWEACEARYPGLMFQPRVLAGLLLLAAVVQSAAIFLLLASVLLWSAAVPTRNPFEALYNRAIAAPRKLPPLQPAPAPRRFAQGLAGTLLGAAGVALMAGQPVIAWAFEGVVVAALAAMIFGRFCLGSYLYHLLRGQSRFANRTLPWSAPEVGDDGTTREA